MIKCFSCELDADFVLEVAWGLPQYFCKGCVPESVKIQFGPEHLKAVVKEPTVEAVAETVAEELVVEAVAEEVPAPAPKKKKSTVAVEEPVVEDEEQVAANVSDNQDSN